MYGTLSDANDYHSTRGNAAWTGADPDKTAALERATDYIDKMFRVRLTSGRWASQFVGDKSTPGDINEWPRDDVVDYDGVERTDGDIPLEIEYATYEAALRELASPGSLMPDFTLTSEQGPVTQETVGPVTVKYADLTQNMEGYESRPPNMPVIPAVERWVAPLLRAVASFNNIGIRTV